MHVTKILGSNGVLAYGVIFRTIYSVSEHSLTELVEVILSLFQIDLRDDGIMVGVADAGDGVGDGAEVRRVKNIIDADEGPEE